MQNEIASGQNLTTTTILIIVAGKGGPKRGNPAMGTSTLMRTVN